MKFVYVYGGCSPHKYSEYVERKGARIAQQAQKYNQLLMEGLIQNGEKVQAVSSRPINRSISSKLFWKGETDYENGIEYYYTPFINCKVLRNISVFIGILFRLLKTHVYKRDSVFICDALNISVAMATLLVGKLRNITTIAIVTDVPCHRPNNKIPLHERVNLFLMRRFNGYLFLTEPMNELVNPEKRPYLVLEGHADKNMATVENCLEKKHKKKVCLYAGSLRKIYGISYLVKGFVVADIPDSELHIYGSGDFQNELAEICKEHTNVKYMGIVPNEVVVAEELKATLLVNPRPTNEDYVKYSFPSKNMEYMASGTPVLTTRLPGMPIDHTDYVFFIDEENEKGIQEALIKIFSNYSEEELWKFGKKAKDFILNEKSNEKQAKRLRDFISENF